MSTSEELKAQAEKFRRWSSVLEDATELEGAFYLGHMSAELIMKSAISKTNNGWHPKGRDSHVLMKLVSERKTNFIASDMANDQNSNVHKLFSFVTSQNQAWKMQYRYEGTKLTASEMSDSLEAYGEIYQWIVKNYSL